MSIKAVLQRLKRRTANHALDSREKIDAIGDGIAILLESVQNVEVTEKPLANGLISGQMYLHLYHGREKADEQLDDWGSNGPYIGPLEAFIDTYRSNPRILFCRFEDQQQFFPEESKGDNVCNPINLLVRATADNPEVSDMILYDGVYYGDYEIIVARDHG